MTSLPSTDGQSGNLQTHLGTATEVAGQCGRARLGSRIASVRVLRTLERNSFIVVTSRPSPLNQANFFNCTVSLVRNSRYQQLAEGIERTDRRELERHQMGFAEWQLLQHGVRRLSVGHIQDEDDTRPVFQRIPLVDLAIEIELRGLANLSRQNALNLRHVRAGGEGADG